MSRVTDSGLLLRAHTKATVVLLLAFSAVSAARQHFGDPIDCAHRMSSRGVPEEALNTYCWISGTYTVPGFMLPPGQAAYPGVAPSAGARGHRHSYYQWVPFILLLQVSLVPTPLFAASVAPPSH